MFPLQHSSYNPLSSSEKAGYTSRYIIHQEPLQSKLNLKKNGNTALCEAELLSSPAYYSCSRNTKEPTRIWWHFSSADAFVSLPCITGSIQKSFCNMLNYYSFGPCYFSTTSTSWLIHSTWKDYGYAGNKTITVKHSTYSTQWVFPNSSH